MELELVIRMKFYISMESTTTTWRASIERDLLPYGIRSRFVAPNEKTENGDVPSLQFILKLGL